MLLELTVKNFLSFGKEQTFSLIANNKRKDGYVKNIKKGTNVLHKAVIYGANASGKTNLLYAMDKIQDSLEERVLDPFLLDEEFKNEPSYLKLTMFREGYFFDYILEFKSTNVIKEELYIYKTQPNEPFFSRTKNATDENYTYSFAKEFRYNSTHQTGLQRLATSRKLFWQIFAENTIDLSEWDKKVVNTYQWFFHNFGNSVKSSARYERFITDDVFKNKINIMIQALDLSIKETIIKKKPLPEEILKRIKEIEEKTEGKFEAPEFMYKKLYKHISNQGAEVLFDEEQISSGTKNIFNLLTKLLSDIEQGNLIIIDELEESLHPHMVRYLVNLFNSPIINKNNAQLIFTTHDISLLDENLFRKDEIYFVEKNSQQMTEIYSLNDFQSKKGESIQSRYFKGKYGAIPNFKASITKLEELYNGKTNS